jgi:Polysaccharide pyruvyl transferase
MTRKFGLMYYSETGNLGDEIQSIAAKQFLPSVDYWLDREYLHEFCLTADDFIPVILNGWFMHHAENWPPSPNIWPLLVSFHISKWRGTGVGLCANDVLLKEPFAKYLQAFGPVGARDYGTLRLLREAGVDSYFSGCLTMTLSRPSELQPRPDLLVLNDVSPEVEAYIRKNTKKEIITTNHGNFVAKDRIRRFGEAERLIQLYATASCVITSRLHCALPSLALGSPVLLLHDGHDEDRFGAGLEFVFHCTTEAFINRKLEFDFNDPAPNSEKFRPYREALIRSVQDFIVTSVEHERMPEFPLSLIDYGAASTIQKDQLARVALIEQKRRKDLEAKIRELSALLDEEENKFAAGREDAYSVSELLHKARKIVS